jgi:hypothetical protein
VSRSDLDEVIVLGELLLGLVLGRLALRSTLVLWEELWGLQVVSGSAYGGAR